MDVTVLHPADVASQDLALWHRWHAATPVATTPFVHPDFVLPAAEVFRTTKVAVIRHDGRTAGFFPFDDVDAVGRTPGGPVNDGDGIVLRPGINLDVVRLLQACGLRSYTYHHMPVAPSPFTPFHNNVIPTARVDVSEGFEQYAARLRDQGSKVLAQARRKTRKLEREFGPIRFELFDDGEAHARTIVSWKEHQVEQRGGTMMRDTPVTDLLRVLGRGTPSEAFASAVSAMYAGPRLVALSWSLRAGGMWVLSVPTFDPELTEHSPGLLLHVALIEALSLLDSVEEIDLGLDINQLKGRLMTHTVDFAKGTVYTSPAMRVYRRAKTGARIAVQRTRDLREWSRATVSGARGASGPAR